MWSVLCNQAPITIEGGQSSSLDVGRNDVVPGDTTFSAVLFQTFYHPGSMIERGIVERLLTLASAAARTNICLLVSLGQR